MSQTPGASAFPLECSGSFRPSGLVRGAPLAAEGRGDCDRCSARLREFLRGSIGRALFSHGHGVTRPFMMGLRMSLAATRMSDAPADSPAPPEVASPSDLYTSQFDFVWRNLRRLGVPDDSLEDAAQDVFLTVHRRWESYDSRRSSIQSWLFGIALRVARGHRRTLRRRLAHLISLTNHRERVLPSQPDSPSDIVARQQSLALLDRILESIDPEKRAVLLLVDVEELSVTEAAEVLGVNLNTLYWRLRSARQSFQRAVDRIRCVEARHLGGACR